MKRTGPTNQELKNLIVELRKKDAPIWKAVAENLEKSSRQRRVVNLVSINKNTKENDTIIVPGKVLGSGDLKHKLTIAAYSFSASALDKIKQSNAKAMSIMEPTKSEVKGKNVRIIG